jgi:hypothetical protein
MIKKLVLLAVIGLYSNISLAQFGQQGGYGQQQGGFGQSNPRFGAGQSNRNPVPTEENSAESEKSKKERFDKIMARLKKELTLDDLQFFAVSGVIKESFKKQEAIMKKEISEQEKTEEIKGVSEISNTKVLEFLNKDQKVKFKTMMGLQN